MPQPEPTPSAPILAITSGEPAGIGPDICLALAQAELPCRCVVLADHTLLAERAAALGQQIRFIPFQAALTPPTPGSGCLEVWHHPVATAVQAGRLNPANAAYVLDLLDIAQQGIVDGVFAGMVTAPLHKGVINDAGVPFSGHTEYLAQASHTEQVVMMLVGGGLRVALATTHLPLQAVPSALSQALILSVLRIMHHDLQQRFHLPKPRILVTGLNPHAGENGHMGREEIDTIIPALQAAQAEGIQALGPYPADTVFQPFLLKDADAVLAMYHDQGLPVLKYASFGQGVNITLGLPFVRTSVDHGTALDLAGSGHADSGSLLAAIDAAYAMLPARMPSQHRQPPRPEPVQ